MQHPILAPVLLLLAPVVAFAAYAESKYPVPSYREAREAFKTNSAKAGGPKFRPEDRRIMDHSARDLAATMPDPGLPVGAKAPDFVLPNAFGKTRRLTDLISDGPVVLVFYRGAWCPYCNLQLRGLHETLPYIEQEGAQLVAITPQTPDKSREQVQKDGYPFEILSDLDDRVMKEYRWTNG